MAFYGDASPYKDTNFVSGYLDTMSWRKVPTSADDILFTVTKAYQHRPDLLAYHLYGDVNLWWVFTARNPTILEDPVFDLVAGVQIYLPQQALMKKTLGI